MAEADPQRHCLRDRLSRVFSVETLDAVDVQRGNLSKTLPHANCRSQMQSAYFFCAWHGGMRSTHIHKLNPQIHGIHEKPLTCSLMLLGFKTLQKMFFLNKQTQKQSKTTCLFCFRKIFKTQGTLPQKLLSETLFSSPRTHARDPTTSPFRRVFGIVEVLEFARHMSRAIAGKDVAAILEASSGWGVGGRKRCVGL